MKTHVIKALLNKVQDRQAGTNPFRHQRNTALSEGGEVFLNIANASVTANNEHNVKVSNLP